MCGIFGWDIRRKSGVGMSQREAVASVLAIANSLRGDQSWGIYYQTKAGNHKVIKQVGDIAGVPTARFAGLGIVMAHTRYATVGKVSEENQHPFKVGSIVLAHNGAVFNHYELKRKYSETRDSIEVDSQHLAHHMAEGLDFKEIEGYGAIEWVNQEKPGRVYLCRMSGGSLSVFAIENAKDEVVGTIWSSDEDHLKSAVGAARLNGFLYKELEEGKIYYTEGGKLYFTDERRVDLSDRSWGARYSRSRYVTSGGSCGYSYEGGDYGLGRIPGLSEEDDDERPYVYDSASGKYLQTVPASKKAREIVSCNADGILVREPDGTLNVLERTDRDSIKKIYEQISDSEWGTAMAFKGVMYRQIDDRLWVSSDGEVLSEDELEEREEEEMEAYLNGRVAHE